MGQVVQQVVKKGKLRPCCKDKSNRQFIEKRDNGISVEQCTCGRKHYRLVADPGIFGIMGKDLGK